LGIQFASKMGFKVAAISTSQDKKKLAEELGAHVYIDSSKEDPVATLKKLGGAKVIMSTVYDAKAMSSVF